MPPSLESPTRPGTVDDGASRVRGRLMQASLKNLLDRVRGARDVLPHLAALEVALGTRGVAALEGIAPHWLAKICSQLSSLPLPEDDPPLHDLLTRLLDALELHRERQAGFDPERTMVIREISHSEFAAASQEQATTQLDRP